MSTPEGFRASKKKKDGQILRRTCGWVKAWLPLSYPSKSYDLSCCSSRWPFLWSESDWTLGVAHGTSPMTNMALPNGVFVPNILASKFVSSLTRHDATWGTSTSEEKQRWWQLRAHPACLEFRSFLRTFRWTTDRVTGCRSEPAGRLFPWSSCGSAACLVKSRYGWYLLSCGGHLEHPKRERSDSKFRYWYG